MNSPSSWFKSSSLLGCNSQETKWPLRQRNRTVKMVLIWSAAFGLQLPMSSFAQLLAGRPVKVELVTESPPVTAGSKAQLQVNWRTEVHLTLGGNNQCRETR